MSDRENISGTIDGEHMAGKSIGLEDIPSIFWGDQEGFVMH